MRKINVGIIGLGTVGGGVVEILKKSKSLGVPLQIAGVADLATEKARELGLDESVITARADDVVNNPDIDIVVELIGGCGAARKIVNLSLQKGKAVVTANKALLAEHGEEIFHIAEEHNTDIYYEASVAGGIPVIKLLREGLVGNKITSIMGIVNGTCNYVLDKMQTEGTDFKQALAEAQQEGYAEQDPALDINGVDSAHKLVILSSLAMGRWVGLDQVYTEGIVNITHSDIMYAGEFGYVIKLLAICKYRRGAIEVRVHPTLLPKRHILSTVSGVYNAIYIKGDNIGSQLYYGKGAGRLPTASAVVADIVDVARDFTAGIKCRIPAIRYTHTGRKVRPIEDNISQCYLRFTTMDRPGVLSQISGILGSNNISIASVIQKGRHRTNAVHIVMMTHKALEKNIKKALEQIDKLPELRAKTIMIRKEE